MRLYAVKTRVVKTGDNMVEVILESLKEQGLQLEDGDVLALTSKIVAYAEERVAKLSDFKPSDKAKELAKKFSLQPEFAELILREADKVYGGVEKAVLTLKNGVLTANAGIDNKNAPAGSVVLWPKNAKEWAKHIREDIIRKTGKRIAVLIVDSGLIPLRLGTTGLALAVAGFKPVTDCRGEKDIFEKPLVITQHAIADDLASAAHLIMGEASEKTPIVLIKDAPVVFDGGIYGSANMMIPSNECIFMNTFEHSRNHQERN
ncbi:MAG: coenzyme F420-0:L-glutamate ligase [Candidatus Bathyarchaeota archaeon]|nr:coenzyme F420-0:L-glutamate ligase [Candidatus Bathyarchaeota archaeon]MDH5753653.1 coenzyme F420-0:L-glutamate ligase [Candidatus Bathyarchaeota archaeon]